MTQILVEKAVIEQALEALEEAYAAQFETTWFEIKPEHFTALQEALAEPDIEEMTLTQIAARHEQAEQKQYPTYGFCPICGSRGISRERRIDGNDTCANGHSYASNLALHIAPEKKAEQEPVAWMNTNGAVNKLREAGWAMNAAPVRTKDLTDDEIAQAVGSPLDEVYLADFRAVIAADREKNK